MMEKVVRWFNWDSIANWGAGVAGAALGLAGGWDALMKVLVTCMVVDYITGIWNAIKEKKLSSKVGFIGILRKLTIFGVVIVAAQVDVALNLQAVCRTAAVAFYAANEGISVLENAAAIGLPVPQKLVDMLGQLKDGGEKEKNANDEDDTVKPA
jgi:toxin secretion/phage lysis holin